MTQFMEVSALGEESADAPIDLFHAAFLLTRERRTKE